MHGVQANSGVGVGCWKMGRISELNLSVHNQKCKSMKDI